ncbi:hypothetical protein [Kitasatospora camelliae]|uniref:Uncharacterized protein n=1 Tax=Kitasatospora camelliae TaxID=3156397 RepID=A0AAU8JRU8_9ACTN
MSTAPHHPGDHSSVPDPERALKYAVQHVAGDRAQYGAPVYFLSDRQNREAFGTPVRLPAPFSLDLDTTAF